MSNQLEGKTVLVTGAAMGIGRAITLAAASEGARLMIGDIAEEALVETAAKAGRLGADVHFRKCDISSQAQLDALVSRCRDSLGVPDVVFANAGIEGPMTDPWAYEEADFARVIDINVMGTWRTMKAVLPAMVERGSGSIVATASIAGLIGAAGVAAYVASKHAVVGLVKSVALSVGRSGVRVNALCPGMIDTAMLDRMATTTPEFREAIMALTPMGRVGTAEEVATGAIWLASDNSTFVTGHALTIDGGFVTQ